MACSAPLVIVREPGPGASGGNFLLKLWDLSSDVYYMLPNRKKHVGTLATCQKQNGGHFSKWPFFLSVLFEKVLE